MPRFSPFVYRFRHNISYAQENWTIVGHWSGRRNNYQALVEAKSNNANKKDLAKFITGNSNDWSLLGGKEKVKLGERVNISSLLAKFERLLREKIASLCKEEKLNSNFQDSTIEFTKDDGTKETDALIGVVEVNASGMASSINAFFGRNTFGSIDCIRAVNLVYAKAVLDVVGTAAFDAVGFTENIPLDAPDGLKKQSMANMLVGDRGWIRNFDDYLAKYPGGAWKAENVIKIANDLYWGFGDPDSRGKRSKSEMGWKNRLREIYNQGIKPEERRNEQVPGFDGEIVFVDVAYIAEVIFSYNITIK